MRARRRSLLAVAIAAALGGCASAHYARVEPGELRGRLVVQWVDQDQFVFVPDAEKPLTFTRHDGDVITPALMYTDGGSIPRPLWALRSYSPWGYAPAFIIHDWIFEMKRCQVTGHEKYDLEEAAWVLAEVMKTMMEKQGPEAVNALALYSIFESVRSPVAARIWEEGECHRVSERGEGPATGIPGMEPRIEYAIEFP
jgi:hypothetical protein